MATYKVIQDIEAEDKLLGPLSLRQFIYAAIVVVCGYVSFRLFFVQPLLIIPLLPIMILFGILAAPFGHDQSSEIWLLAKIRFMLKPRQRVWDQTGLQEQVTITAPKRPETTLTNGLDPTQVKSRLQALAQTIDTRGWAVKGVDVNMYTNPTYGSPNSDRLIDASVLSQSSAMPAEVHAADDILDEKANPVAQQMDQLVKANDQAHRQTVLDNMQQIRAGHPLQGTSMPLLQTDPVQAYGHTAVLQPPHQKKPVAATPAQPLQKPGATPSNTPAQPAILELAHNDDLSVATIARQANKATHTGDNEVVISLR